MSSLCYPPNDPALLDLTAASSDEVGYTPDQLIAGTDIRTTEVLVTGGVNYHRGDLLAFDPATNTVQPAATAADAHFICPCNMTTDQSTAHAGGNYLLQVYSAGQFSELDVLLGGVPLSATDIATARGTLNAIGVIRLRKMT